MYWRAATEQAQHNHACSQTEETRNVLTHTLREYRSALGCFCCGKCGRHHISQAHVASDGTSAMECTHGIPRDPQE